MAAVAGLGVTSSATRPPAWNRILSGLNLRKALGHLGREEKEEGKVRVSMERERRKGWKKGRRGEREEKGR